jgi:hypothetical protein
MDMTIKRIKILALKFRELIEHMMRSPQIQVKPHGIIEVAPGSHCVCTCPHNRKSAFGQLIFQCRQKALGAVMITGLDVDFILLSRKSYEVFKKYVRHKYAGMIRIRQFRTDLS